MPIPIRATHPVALVGLTHSGKTCVRRRLQGMGYGVVARTLDPEPFTLHLRSKSGTTSLYFVDNAGVEEWNEDGAGIEEWDEGWAAQVVSSSACFTLVICDRRATSFKVGVAIHNYLKAAGRGSILVGTKDDPAEQENEEDLVKLDIFKAQTDLVTSAKRDTGFGELLRLLEERLAE